MLTRYVGLSKVAPKLGLLGSNRWGKIYRCAEKGALDFAAELLKMQAKRQTYKRPQCEPDNAWQTAFENAFIHNETADQLSAIDATKKTLKRNTHGSSSLWRRRVWENRSRYNGLLSKL